MRSDKKTTVKSSVVLTDKQKKSITEILKKSISIENVNFVVDEKILGGIVVNHGSNTIDLSIDDELKQLIEIYENAIQKK